MEDFESRVVENLSDLARVIGSDNLTDVQKRIGDLIVNQVASDLRHYDMYLFYPGDYQSSIDEAFEKVQKKIIKMYTDAMLEVAQKSVEKFKEIALVGVQGVVKEYSEMP